MSQTKTDKASTSLEAEHEASQELAAIEECCAYTNKIMKTLKARPAHALSPEAWNKISALKGWLIGFASNVDQTEFLSRDRLEQTPKHRVPLCLSDTSEQ